MSEVSTKGTGILIFLCHIEGGQIAAVNCWFAINLVHTIAVISQLSVQQVRKHGVKCSETVDITVDDHL